MLRDLVPNAIDKSNLVCQKFFVCQTRHQVSNLCVRSHSKDARAFAYFIFAFGEIVVELINELLTLLQRLNVPLAPTVPLVLEHGATGIGASHLQIEARSLDLSLICLGCPLLRR